MASIESLSSHKPKFTNHKLYILPKSSSLFKPRAVPFQQTKLHLSSKPSKLITQSKISDLPGSKFSAQKPFIKYLAEKIAILLIGSFVLVGCFNVRPSLAMAGSSSEEMKNKRETQKEDEDEEIYERYLEQNPDHVDALKVVLYRKLRSGKAEEAVKLVERLIDLKPDEVEWRLLQALCYETIGNLSEAKRLYREILKDWPLMLRALHGLAMVMHKDHETSAVFEMLNKALETARSQQKATEERSIRILIAQMHVIKGELVESLNEFQDLIKDNPRDFRPYLCQGIVYSLLNKKEEAEKQFETYRLLVPEEFPERGYLDDVVLAAKTSSQDHLEEEFKAQFSPKN